MTQGLKFGYKHYVPILKGRRGEFPALKAVKNKDSVTPLLEPVPKYNCDYIAERMAKSWDATHPFFVDFLHYQYDEEDRGGVTAHPIVHCFGAITSAGLSAIPVTGTGRSPAYQSAIRKAVAKSKRGVAVRLVAMDFDETDLTTALDALLGIVDTERAETDIIIDVGSVAAVQSATVSAMHAANLSLLPHINEWRTVTVAATAFPNGLGELDRDTWNPKSRSDWLGWKSLVTGARKPTRLPAYADYAIAHPGVPPDGRATILAQLRYSAPASFLIWKGSDVKKHPKKYHQFLDICKKLVARPECKPASFSFGDKMIHEKATIGGKPGNSETWRTIGVNHHAEMVIHQLASLP